MKALGEELWDGWGGECIWVHEWEWMYASLKKRQCRGCKVSANWCWG